MKQIRILIALLALSISSTLSAKLVKGHVLLNGVRVPAEYTVLTDNTVSLGSGRNASISQYCSGRVTIPDTINVSGKKYAVKEMMPMAFRLCSRIRFVRVPEGVTRIGSFAFVGCSSLHEVCLPSTLTKVGTGAFAGLQTLHHVNCAAVTPPTWEYNDVFHFHPGGISGSIVYQFPDDVRLCVPVGSVEAYRTSTFSDASLRWTTAEGWGTAFKNIDGGIQENFRVYDIEDFEDLTYLLNSSEKVDAIYIETDINAANKPFTPIGTGKHPFKGTVYGQGHTISNLDVRTDSIAGLFGYFEGPAIGNLRLKSCSFRGKTVVGALAAHTKGCRIDSVWVEAALHGGTVIGGLVGDAQGRVTIDRCAANAVSFYADQGSPAAAIGALIGQASDAAITNCAIVADAAPSATVANFVEKGKASVDYTYIMRRDADRFRHSDGVQLGSHVIISGDKLTILDMGGNKMECVYDDTYFRNVFPASVLGFQAWGYSNGLLPMPDCFTDEWPDKVNFATYGSPSMAAARVNTLTPDGDIPASAWLDLSEQGFRHFRFQASRLWVDDNLDAVYDYNQVPLGYAEQIVSDKGVRIDRILYAEDKGVRAVKEPLYKADENGVIILGTDNKPILVDYLDLGTERVWGPKAYAFSLPYNVALSDNCVLYQPTRLFDINGRKTALFERVRENYVEAFRPYYLLINRDSVSLGTDAKVVSPKASSNITRFGDYEFVASNGRMNNVYARQHNIYKLDGNDSWAYLKGTGDLDFEMQPYMSYFTTSQKTPAPTIAIELEDNNPVISVGDFYFSINNADPANVTATLVGYHGRGGNAVAPATVPYVLYGVERQAPVTALGPDIFADCTAEVWSIDLSACRDLQPVTIDRAAPGNAFYKLDGRAIIYLPEGKAAGGRNVVVGTECQAVTITDKWDFRPPCSFHADEVEYSRIFYATKLADGSYQSYAYSFCLPFGVSESDWNEIDPDGQVALYALQYVNTSDRRAFVFSAHPGLLGNSMYPTAGLPYILLIHEGQIQLKARDTWVEATPQSYEYRVLDYDNSDVLGDFRGTFARISNEHAAAVNAYSMNKGKWCRIRNDQGSYRGAYLDAFRAFFVPERPLALNTYASDYVAEPQGFYDVFYSGFPADDFAIDSDFTGYDIEDAIRCVQAEEQAPRGADSAIYNMAGQRLHKLQKGLNIVNGKKVIIQ